MKVVPLPAIDFVQREQTKQPECQCRPSKEMNLQTILKINYYFGSYLLVN
jgi:hypothetical protein